MGGELTLIFDMDGTIIDNMLYHLKAWERLAAGSGSDLKGNKLFNLHYGKNEEVLVRIFGTMKSIVITTSHEPGLSKNMKIFYSLFPILAA